MRKLFFLILLSAHLFGYTRHDIDMAIYGVAVSQGVQPKVLYTIVKIESDFDPFTISFLTNMENAKYFSNLSSPNIDVKISKYSLNNTKWAVAIHPANEILAMQIASLLIKDGFNIDVGLGQLNSVNFTPDEIPQIFSPTYNLTKCAKVLRKCFNAKNKNLTNTIECYNYGMRRRPSNPYFNKFFRHYKEFFGDPTR